MEKEKMKLSNVIIGIIKAICVIVLVILIVAIALQRFSNNNISFFGYRVFNVASESMVPEYQIGDILLVKEVELDSLEIGNNITYFGEKGDFAGKVVTHQLIEIENSEKGKIYHTKGIANPEEDPTIRGDQIYGKVIYKAFLVSKLSKILNNMYAFYFLIFIPLVVLIGMIIQDFIHQLPKILLVFMICLVDPMNKR